MDESILNARRIFYYWRDLHKAAFSNTVVLESSPPEWRQALKMVEEQVVTTYKTYADIHVAWMKPTSYSLEMGTF